MSTPSSAFRHRIARVVAGTVGALALAACKPAAPPAPPPPPPAPATPPPPVVLTPAQIAARAMPAVVAIRGPRSLGTGFVVRKDGWIATNFHVVAGEPELRVVTTDKHEFPVLEIVSADAVRDLALIHVEASDLPVVLLGDSDAVHPGDSVVAIGHPLGLEDTVSNGLVSAVREIDQNLTLLQISAPIAPGSSGGPLFNDRGEVIGVASRYSPKGQNLNFGIPIRYLKLLARDPRPVPLAAFAAATTKAGPAPQPSMPTVKRDVPHHELSLLAGCTDQDLEQTGRLIAEAIDVGAPVYNEGHFAACYHVYDGAALEVEKRLPSACSGPKRAMKDGRTRAAKLDDPSAQAFAMRDAFDGLMEVVLRHFALKKAEQERAAPSLQPDRR
jgi:hypothetical protein